MPEQTLDITQIKAQLADKRGAERAQRAAAARHSAWAAAEPPAPHPRGTAPRFHSGRSYGDPMQCRRFQSDGTRCRNTTENVDGWCRQRGCSGFIRPVATGNDYEERATMAPGRAGQRYPDPAQVQVAPAAVDRYLEIHGGDRDIAESALVAMVADFAESTRLKARKQSVKMRRDGVVLTLSTDLQFLIDYNVPMSRDADTSVCSSSTQPGAPEDRPIGLDAIGLEPAEVEITRLVLRRFQEAHGGDQRAAEASLANMIEDFSRSAKARVRNGRLTLHSSGFTLVFSKDRTALIDYQTLHRERTWEQVKAGVKSRYSAKPATPPPGDPVDLAGFATAFDPETVYVTLFVVNSFRKLEGMAGQPKDEVISAIRRRVADLASGHIEQLDNGVFGVCVEAGTVYWLVSADCRRLIGFKPVTTAV